MLCKPFLRFLHALTRLIALLLESCFFVFVPPPPCLCSSALGPRFASSLYQPPDGLPFFCFPIQFSISSRRKAVAGHLPGAYMFNPLDAPPSLNSPPFLPYPSIRGVFRSDRACTFWSFFLFFSVSPVVWISPKLLIVFACTFRPPFFFFRQFIHRPFFHHSGTLSELSFVVNALGPSFFYAGNSAIYGHAETDYHSKFFSALLSSGAFCPSSFIFSPGPEAGVLIGFNPLPISTPCTAPCLCF